MAVVHGMLAKLKVEMPVEATYGSVFDGGRGVELAFDLPGGGRVRIDPSQSADRAGLYRAVTVYCVDRIIELVFPSPYLRHFPTRLTVRRGGAEKSLETTEYRVSYEESFRDQLRAFHAAITEGGPVTTPIEQARRDVELLISASKKAGA